MVVTVVLRFSDGGVWTRQSAGRKIWAVTRSVGQPGDPTAARAPGHRPPHLQCVTYWLLNRDHCSAPPQDNTEIFCHWHWNILGEPAAANISEESKRRGEERATPRRVWSCCENQRQHKWIDFPIMDSQQFSPNWLLHLWKFPSHLFRPQRISSYFCLLLRRGERPGWWWFRSEYNLDEQRQRRAGNHVLQFHT